MKKKIAVIGGGPAAMMLCTALNTEKYEVTIFEKMPTIGRKFLVAGKGGFNLTHSENRDALIERYTPSTFFQPILNRFDNQDLRNGFLILASKLLSERAKEFFQSKASNPSMYCQPLKKRSSKYVYYKLR